MKSYVHSEIHAIQNNNTSIGVVLAELPSRKEWLCFDRPSYRTPECLGNEISYEENQGFSSCLWTEKKHLKSFSLRFPWCCRKCCLVLFGCIVYNYLKIICVLKTWLYDMNGLRWSMILWGWRGIEIERRISLDSPHLCCFQNLGAWIYNYICIYHIHMQSMYSTVYLHPKIRFPQTSITSSPQTAYHSHILGIWPFLTNILTSNLQFPHLISTWLTIVKLQWTCCRPPLCRKNTSLQWE